MKTAISFALLLLVTYLPANCQRVKKEKEAMQLVGALPETISYMKTAKNSRPSIVIAGPPGKYFKYYWVKVGVSNMDIFRTNFDFYVDPKTAIVYYLDVYTEYGTKTITLQQWRQWRKTAAWKKTHNYKYRDGKLVLLPKQSQL